MEKTLTVGRLADMTGLSRKSIRYYEQERLIPKAGRTTSGYRIYNTKVIERLKFIQKAKAIGFHLEDIRRMLELTDKGKPCCEKVFEWSEKRLGELDEQIKFLTQLKKKIVHHQNKWKLQKQVPSQIQKLPQSEICDLIAEVEMPKEKRQ